MVLLSAGGGDGAVFDGFADARAGRSRRGDPLERGRSEISGEPVLGESADAATSGIRRGRTSASSRFQEARVCRPGGSVTGPGRRQPRSDALGTARRHGELGKFVDRVARAGSAGPNPQKKPSTPTNNDGRTSPLSGAGGVRRNRSAILGSMCSLTNAASQLT